ncbi:hypothetical protein ACH492_25840 [Streptomyces sp. NPDC019443]|uniref:hypothetical protein n=1 Tax=Streptomyces sp. NPDC019443 TaxID=3365061 RepID=UPI0037889BD1
MAATSADVLGTEPDVEQPARRRLWPVPAGGHRLADAVTRRRRTRCWTGSSVAHQVRAGGLLIRRLPLSLGTSALRSEAL